MPTAAEIASRLKKTPRVTPTKVSPTAAYVVWRDSVIEFNPGLYVPAMSPTSARWAGAALNAAFDCWKHFGLAPDMAMFAEFLKFLASRWGDQGKGVSSLLRENGQAAQFTFQSGGYPSLNLLAKVSSVVELATLYAAHKKAGTLFDIDCTGAAPETTPAPNSEGVPASGSLYEKALTSRTDAVGESRTFVSPTVVTVSGFSVEGLQAFEATQSGDNFLPWASRDHKKFSRFVALVAMKAKNWSDL